jgi:hypothetical protein
MRKAITAAVIASALSAALALPVGAINDTRVPGDECSPNNSAAVGNPTGGNPGIAQADPVGPPASANNPGQSTGARGQTQSEATDHCPNAP